MLEFKIPYETLIGNVTPRVRSAQTAEPSSVFVNRLALMLKLLSATEISDHNLEKKEDGNIRI